MTSSIVSTVPGLLSHPRKSRQTGPWNLKIWSSSRDRDHILFLPEKKYISYTPRNVVNRYRSMTTMIKNQTPVQVPADSGKKLRATRKKPAAKGFFGLLPDREIDTQALKDELRD